MSELYKAAVIGAGMIGAGMDMPENKPPQTHAGAYKQHKSFDLVGICDPDIDEHFEVWGCNLYTNLDKLLAENEIDVASVAVPEQQQYDILARLLDTPVQAVIAEKPLADNLEQARAIVQAYEDADIPLLVNYSRRYSSMYQDMGKRFRSGEERVVSATMRYAKGLHHNGCHALDLALMLFGDLQNAQALAKITDFYDDDPTVSAFLTFTHCPHFFLQALDERLYTLFEVDIFTDQARYIINNDHRDLHVCSIEDNSGIPPGKRLVYKETLNTDYDEVILSLVDNLYNVLANNKNPLCSAKEALRSLEIADELG